MFKKNANPGETPTPPATPATPPVEASPATTHLEALPPYQAMGLLPYLVLSFAQHDGFWVVVTNNGQKHHYPVFSEG